MNIFENAIAAIQVGLEDYIKGTPNRLLSAVRNLHSGILLLYKAKLSALSPAGTGDVLIKKRIVPAKSPTGGIIFVGDGRNTVDVHEIKERFESLGVATDWKRFKKISSLRNDIEHHSTTITGAAMQETISDTFAIIRNFIVDELASDPKEELGDDTYNVLLTVSEVHEKEREECERKLSAIDWGSPSLEDAALDASCDNCGSSLLVPVGRSCDWGVECRACSDTELFEDFAQRALSEHFTSENHHSIKDGGDAVLITCPFCHQTAYVVDEGKCAICHESCPTDCDRCGNGIPVCELSDDSVCSWCSHMASKDD